MRTRTSRALPRGRDDLRLGLAAVALAAATVPAASVTPAEAHRRAADRQYLTFHAEDGTRIDYVRMLPDDFDPERAYPVILAMPPGGQTMREVDWGLDTFWGEAATDRGWVVISPAAPEGGWRDDDAVAAVRALLRELRQLVRIEGDRVHLVGCSNGGISAFGLALSIPATFASLTVLPGRPAGAVSARDLSRLSNMRVRLYVGADDGGWVSAAERTHDALLEGGVEAELEVFPGEGHIVRPLAGGGLMERMAELR